MSYLYLILATLSLSASGIFAGCFARKTSDKKDASALGGFIELSAVFVLWAVMFCLDFTASSTTEPTF